jgi:hypothetical protein
MKKKEKANDYVKANRKGSREAELEFSAGWTAKTKVHKSKKQYDRKSQNWKNDSGFFHFSSAFFVYLIAQITLFVSFLPGLVEKNSINFFLCPFVSPFKENMCTFVPLSILKKHL